VTLTVTVPDELARRLQAAAAARGVSVEQLAVEVLSGVDTPIDDGEARAALEAFIGAGAGDGTRFEIHDARRDLAARRRADGTSRL
jgi:hypothetical protein